MHFLHIFLFERGNVAVSVQDVEIFGWRMNYASGSESQLERAVDARGTAGSAFDRAQPSFSARGQHQRRFKVYQG